MIHRYWTVIAILVGITSGAWTEEIRATSFVLEDDWGRERAALETVKGKPKLQLYGENGKPRILMGVEEDGAKVVLFDEAGKPRIRLYVGEDGMIIALSDENVVTRMALTTDEFGPGVYLYYEKPSPPAIGMVLIEDGPGPGLLIVDENGKLIWSAP